MRKMQPRSMSENYQKMLNKRGKAQSPQKVTHNHNTTKGRDLSLEKVETFYLGNEIKLEEFKQDYSIDEYGNSYKNTYQREQDQEVYDSNDYEDDSNTKTSANKADTTLHLNSVIAPILTESTIKSEFLQAVWYSQLESLKQQLSVLEKARNKEEFYYKLMVGFWLAVRMESVTLVNFFIKRSKGFIHYILRDFRHQVKRRIDDIEKEISDKHQLIPDNIKPHLQRIYHQWQDEYRHFKKNIAHMKRDKATNKTSQFENEYYEGQMEEYRYQEPFIRIHSVNQIREINGLFMLSVAKPFNTNLLRVALQMEEDSVASVIAAYYEMVIDEDLFDIAVKKSMFGFLYALYAYNKNEVQLLINTTAKKSNINRNPSFLGESTGTLKNLESSLNQSRVDMSFNLAVVKSKRESFASNSMRVLQTGQNQSFTKRHTTGQKNVSPGMKRVKRRLYYNDLFRKICEVFKQNAAEKLRIVARDWRLNPTDDENMLRSLLVLHQDQVATECATFYQKDLTFELFMLCIDNNNEIFLAYSLLNNLFPNRFVDRDEVIRKILSEFENGEKSDLYLNIMNFANFSLWHHRHLVNLLNIFKEVANNDYAHNRILLSYNPILFISLCCEYLESIGQRISIFEHNCQLIKTKILSLGKKIIENMKFEDIEQIFMDKDYKNRTVINIITSNEFKELLANNKINTLLDSLFIGKEPFKCDGRIQDFSTLTHITVKPLKKMPQEVLGMFELFEARYKLIGNREKFWWQYAFRTQSVRYIYCKELLCAFAVMILFQYTNFQYMSLFDPKLYRELPSDQDLTTLHEANKAEYYSLGISGIIISASIILNVLQKAIFNSIASEQEFKYDMWILVDLMTAVINFIGFLICLTLVAVDIINIDTKHNIDCFMAFVIAITWIRFFFYFLLVQQISRMVMTLAKILKHTGAFLFIICSYIVLAGIVFNLSFSDVAPQHYGTMALSIRTMLDIMTGNYQYEYMGDKDKVHSVLLMIHAVISSIILINFLAAMFSTAYKFLLQSGEFSYKSIKYQFFEKYANALVLKRGIKEIILHAPPFNLITCWLIPLYISKRLADRVGSTIAKIIFWFENILYIALFLVYEACLSPLVFFKVLWNIFKVGTSKQKFLYTVVWVLFGFLFLSFYMIKDVIAFIHLLLEYRLSEINQISQQFLHLQDDKVIIYNELLQTMISIYIAIEEKKEDMEKQHKGANDQRNNETKGGDRRSIIHSKSLSLNVNQKSDIFSKENEQFQVSMKVLIHSWKRFRSQNEKERLNWNTEEGDTETKIEDVLGIKLYGKLFEQLDKGAQFLRRQTMRGRPSTKGLQNKLIAALQKDIDSAASSGDETQDTEMERELNTISEEELKIVQDFLMKFVIVSETSGSDHVNLKLVLKSLPCLILHSNLYKVELFNFVELQKSLIAFQNDDMDELFNFYDERNKGRFSKLKKKQDDNEKAMSKMVDMFSQMKDKFDKTVSQVRMKMQEEIHK